jgi:3'-phosphoadenosine 5'-phosphosulfate sulfotransferase (PAPS reductase)/FAD synthetase
MNHVVSFSGGRTSAYLVYLIESMRKSGEWTEPVEYIFMDTGAEHPKTYEFIKKCVEHFGIELTCLRAVIPKEIGAGPTYKVIDIKDIGFDLSIFKEFMAKYGNPTINRPICTDKLKTIPAVKYKNDKYGKGNHATWMGMRIDEPRRLKGIPDQLDAFTNVKPREYFYLAELSDFTKQDVIDWWSKMPFDLEITEHLGNCVFCIKKTSAKIALAERDESELFQEWNAAMNDSSVRLMPADKFGIGHIYRNWMTPEMLIKQFSDHSTDELRQRIFKEKRFETGSCTESCEAFATDQLDMFGE